MTWKNTEKWGCLTFLSETAPSFITLGNTLSISVINCSDFHAPIFYQQSIFRPNQPDYYWGYGQNKHRLILPQGKLADMFIAIAVGQKTEQELLTWIQNHLG